MADNTGSSNTAIIAIFAMLVLLAVGYFVWRNNASPSHNTKIEVSVPKLPDKAPAPPS